jgi:hypothetical protein
MRKVLTQMGWRWCLLLPLVGLASGSLIPAQEEGSKPTVSGQEKKSVELPADLQRISADAGGFLSVRVADLWDSELARPMREKMGQNVKEMDAQLREKLGVTLAEIERVDAILLEPLPETRGEMVALLATRKAFDREGVLTAIGKKEEVQVEDQTVYVGERGVAVHWIGERAFAVGETKALRRFLQMPARSEGPLHDALSRAAGKHTLVAGINCTRLPRLLDEDLGGELRPYRDLLRPLFHAQAGMAIIDLGEQVQVRLEASFARERDAQVAAKALGGLQLVLLGLLDRPLHEMQEQKELEAVVRQARQLQAALRAAPIEQKGTTLQSTARVPINRDLAAVFTEVPERVRKASRLSQTQNNLKQIALAMHNYHDSYAHLPTQAILGKDGKPLLSWRVAILPFIEQQQLYMQFHLDEPWDSPHNKKWLETMPKTYASPTDPEGTQKYQTHYLGFVGPNAFFEGKQGMRIPADFPDGTSNTIMVVEASKSVPWTKPEDIDFDPDKPLPKIGGLFPNGFVAALCDGSVRLVSRKISNQTLKYAIMRSDGFPLGPDW